MPTLLMVGAGNIGRGFIAPLFCAAGWRVVFADIDRGRIAALSERRRYRLIEVGPGGERDVAVEPVDGIDAADREAMAAAWATCDLAATAVGAANLPGLVSALATGWVARGGRPLDILVCENGADPAGILRGALPSGVTPGLVRTAIGRMIPASTLTDPLDIQVEPWCHLPVERSAFTGPVPEVPHLDAVPDIAAVLAMKLYLHNGSHAALAYAGARRGCRTIDACMAQEDLVAMVRAGGCEVALAIGRRHGGDALLQAQTILGDLLARYRNPRLADPVARVGRDPWRKLASDDRLLGGMRLCLEQGLEPWALGHLAACGLCWQAAPDEPEAARWNALGSPAARLAALRIADDDPRRRWLAC